MSETVIDLGVGLYTIGGSAANWPPRIELYRQPHDQPTGAEVPEEERRGEPEVVLTFHTKKALDAFRRALDITDEWFDQPRAYKIRKVL